MPALVHDAQKNQRSDREQVCPGCRLDAEEAADIKRTKMKGAEGGFIFQDAPADQNAADGEKQVDAVSAVPTKVHVRVPQDVPHLVVGDDDAPNRQGTPAVETGQVA